MAVPRGKYRALSPIRCMVTDLMHFSMRTPTVTAKFGAENVIVVKDAQGGQPIRRWYKQWKPEGGKKPDGNGDLYDRLMAK